VAPLTEQGDEGALAAYDLKLNLRIGVAVKAKEPGYPTQVMRSFEL